VADFMQTGPVLALAVEGADAVTAIRKLVGATFPAEAAPGTIRGDFAHHSNAHADDAGRAVMNLVHASGNAEEAAYEVGLWFADDELFDYASAVEAFTF
jgi:nucleoside-diphosphate kinase